MFGDYNSIIDEAVHVILNLIVVITMLITGHINLYFSLILVLAGTIIDLDHLFNPLIGKLLGIKATIIPSKEQYGHTIKILHGLDLFFVMAATTYFITGEVALSVGLFLVLTGHEFWDFVVYDHTWKELFLITRAKTRFLPGKRKQYTGLIFNSNSLPM